MLNLAIALVVLVLGVLKVRTDVHFWGWVALPAAIAALLISMQSVKANKASATLILSTTLFIVIVSMFLIMW